MRSRPKICTKPGCNMPVKAEGLCRKHYDQDYYDLSKGNGAAKPGPAALNGHGGRQCVECDRALVYRADDATMCGACLREAWLRACNRGVNPFRIYVGCYDTLQVFRKKPSGFSCTCFLSCASCLSRATLCCNLNKSISDSHTSRARHG